jgi:hypothetical protein
VYGRLSRHRARLEGELQTEQGYHLGFAVWLV